MQLDFFAREYAGWPNYVTWAVYTHLGKDAETHAAACQVVREGGPGGLRDWVWEELLDIGNNNLADDLLAAVIDAVDWEVLAEALSEE